MQPLDSQTRPSFRLSLLAILFICAMVPLLAKLWELQISRAEQYREKTRAKVTKSIVLPPARGLIADRWGVALAEHRPSVDIDLYLIELLSSYRTKHRSIPRIKVQVRQNGVLVEKEEPDIVAVVEDCIAPLRKILGDRLSYDPNALRLHQRIRDRQPFTLKSELTPEEIAIWYEQNANVPGVEIAFRPVRRYPRGATASHLLGFVGAPQDARIVERDGRKIELTSEGKVGIEKQYDMELQGVPGYRDLLVNSMGSVIKRLDYVPPALGGTVYLTLDLRVQQIVERVMSKVGRGAAVVVDAQSGDLLAMASVPSYDPNKILDKETWKDVVWNPTHPLVNRAIAAYAPGSIFKPMVALAALKYNVVSPNFSTSCGGGMNVTPDRYAKCWSAKIGGCGTLSMEGAIKRSCNVYFYTVGMKTGGERVAEVCHQLGLGQPSGLNLKNESPGSIPSPSWMKAKYPKDRWSNGHMANMAIGQGYVEVSPLQMAYATAAIGNGGTCYYPRLISHITDAEGNVTHTNELARVRAQLDLPREKIEIVRRGMRAVVNESGGTASRARLEDVIVSGKTGTAQFQTVLRGVRQADNRTWFISFAPYDTPRYAICVVVEGGESGGGTTAPLVAEIYRGIFDLERGANSYQLVYMPPNRGFFGGVRDADPNLPGGFTAPENPGTLVMQGRAVPFDQIEPGVVEGRAVPFDMTDPSVVEGRAVPFDDPAAEPAAP